MILVLSLLGAAVIGALGKEMFDRLNVLKHRNVRSHIRKNDTKLIESESNEALVVPLHRLEVHIADALEDTDGGVWIFGAPLGSGKSTYLDKCLDVFKKGCVRHAIHCHNLQLFYGSHGGVSVVSFFMFFLPFQVKVAALLFYCDCYSRHYCIHKKSCQQQTLLGKELLDSILF
jgi:hypothetical protein